MTTISWFSAGGSSAVATKLEIDNIDRIIYTHIEDQHEDTLRFVRECEEWFGKPVEIMQSKYKTVASACLGAGGKGYINGPTGAACSMRLKRDLRLEFEKKHSKEPLSYVWGIDYSESGRCLGLEEQMPTREHIFPLVNRKMDKNTVHQILTASGIKRPTMYDLGYLNNNCIGCPKGGMAYWNKIRVDFPKVFKARAEMERKIGATCLKDKNGRIYLDELDPERGRDSPPIVAECGILCGVIGI